MPLALPSRSFDTVRFPTRDQFAAWCDSIAPMFDAAPAKDRQPTGFLGAYQTFFAGPLILGGTSFDGHRYGRDAARGRRDGLNHYHVSLQLGGHLAGRLGDQEISVGPGDIVLLDFTRPFAIEAQRSDLLVIGVPREAMELNIAPANEHGLILRGETGLGSLLGDHMRSLISRLPLMTAEEGTAAAAGSVAMIAACFQPAAATFARAKSELLDSLLVQMRRHIAQRLREGELDVDTLCRVFGISRATLYRLFEPFGGVATYIHNQRLSHVFTALMNPLQNHCRISEIAHDWGFSSESHFSRSFRKAFGMSPSEARAVLKQDEPAQAGLREWIPMMRRT